MIHYLTGDATEPTVKEGIRVIIHVVNSIGKWGAGFSGAVSAKWKEPEDFYRRQFRFSNHRFNLGGVQWVFVEQHLAVVNLIAQEGVRGASNPKPIRYEALESCLNRLAESCHHLMDDAGIHPPRTQEVTIHMPRIGCGLAGASWDTVGPIVEESLWDLQTYVYDLQR